MRIGLVSDCYYPTKNGVTGVVAMLADGLRRRGHEVTLIVPAFPGTPPKGGPADAIPALSADVGAMLPRPDVEVASLPLFPSIQLRLPIGSSRRLQEIFCRAGIDLVHTHTEGPLGRAARDAALRTGRPTVHTLHTLYDHYLHYLWPARLAPRTSGRTMRRHLSRFLHPYDRVIAPSPRALDHLRAIAPATPRTLVPNGIPIAGAPTNPDLAEHLRRRLGLARSTRVVLYVGRIAEEKRSEALFDALAEHLQGADDVTAVLVGGGGHLRRLRGRARRLALEDQIRLPGYLEHAEVLALYRLASLFITVSLSENHPLTLLEAAAAGLPLAIRGDPNLEAIAINGVNAVVAKDDGELVARALALLDRPRRLTRMGAVSRRMAERFTAARHLERTEGVYTDLVSSGRRHPTELARHHSRR